MTTLTAMLLFATGSVALALLDPIWLRLGQRSYWKFMPMARYVRVSPRLRGNARLEQFLNRVGTMWGSPIEWRRSEGGIEFHGCGWLRQWIGCGRIVDPGGSGWLFVEIPARQIYLLPLAVANILLAGPLGLPVAAGLLMPAIMAFLVQRNFAARVELAARFLVMKPERQAALMNIARRRVQRRAR
ncbi:MAG: hypothetical protein HY286_02480 [Planctomycetes bacterium]|nr:hypothetical protein [Planctomycetota bacterium]